MRVPCGVCDGPHSQEWATMRARYGVDLVPTVRSEIREHLAKSVRVMYPDSVVTVE